MEDLRATPYSEEAEKAVLGAMLIDTRSILAGQLSLTENSFWVDKHKYVFNALNQIYVGRDIADFVAIINTLEKNDHLEQVGKDYIIELGNFVPSSANIDYYIRIVKEKEAYRNMILVCNNIIQHSYIEDEEIETLKDMFKNADISEHNSNFNLKTSTIQSFTKYAEVLKQLEKKPYLCGFRFVDVFLISLLPKEQLLIVAEGGIGKTRLAIKMLRYIIAKEIPVIIFSLEMDQEEIEFWVQIQNVPVDFQSDPFKTIQGMYLETEDKNDPEKTEENVKKLALNYLKQTHNNLHIFDQPGMTVPMMEFHTKRIIRETKRIPYVIIDSFGEIALNSRFQSQNEKEEKIATQLKSFRKETGTPQCVIHHTNAIGEFRGNRKVIDRSNFIVYLSYADKKTKKYIKPTWGKTRGKRGPRIQTYLDINKNLKEIDEIPTANTTQDWTENDN